MYSRDYSEANIEDEAAGEHEDTKDEDIIERWKKGRFRPKVESRRPVRGFERGRPRMGGGRGRFSGPFRRNAPENRQQDVKLDRTQRERRRSSSQENYRKRLPGRFDRQRSRSDSREHQHLRAKDRDNINEGRSQSREKSAEPKISKQTSGDRGNVSPDTRRMYQNGKSEEKKRSASKRRWDQKSENMEEDKKTAKTEIAMKNKHDSSGKIEAESVVKEIKGRWEREDSSDDESNEKEEVTFEEKTVDMFGRDISKRFEYKMKKKQFESRKPAVNLSDENVVHDRRIDEVLRQKEDGLSLSGTSFVDEVSGRHEDEEVYFPNVEKDLEHDQSDNSNVEAKESKKKTEKKKKHRKKDKKKKKGKKSRKAKRKRRDDLADSDIEESINEASEIAERMNEKNEKRDYVKKTAKANNEYLSEEERVEGPVKSGQASRQIQAVHANLDVESEIRERIKLKMKQRFDGSLVKGNVLSPEEKESTPESLSKTLTEKGAENVHETAMTSNHLVDNDYSSPEPENQHDARHEFRDAKFKRDKDRVKAKNERTKSEKTDLLDSKSGKAERGYDNDSGSQGDIKRKSLKARRRRHSKEEISAKVERRRSKSRDAISSSDEDKMYARKRRRDTEGPIESKKEDKKGRRDVKRGTRRRSTSYSASDTEEEADGKRLVQSSMVQVGKRSESASSIQRETISRRETRNARRSDGSSESVRKVSKRKKDTARGRSRSDWSSSSEHSSSRERSAKKKTHDKKKKDKLETRSRRDSESSSVRPMSHGRVSRKESKKASRKDVMIHELDDIKLPKISMGRRISRYSSENSSATNTDDERGAKRIPRKDVPKRKSGHKNEEKEIYRYKVAEGMHSDSEDSNEGDNEEQRSKRASRRDRDRESKERSASRRSKEMLSGSKEEHHKDGKDRARDSLRKRSECKESDASSSDDAVEVELEDRRKHTARKNYGTDSSSQERRKEKADKLKRSSKQEKRARRYEISTDSEKSGGKKYGGRLKMKERDVSMEKERRKDRRGRERSGSSTPDDVGEIKISESKRKNRLSREKKKRGEDNLGESFDEIKGDVRKKQRHHHEARVKEEDGKKGVNETKAHEREERSVVDDRKREKFDLTTSSSATRRSHSKEPLTQVIEMTHASRIAMHRSTVDKQTLLSDDDIKTIESQMATKAEYGEKEGRSAKDDGSSSDSDFSLYGDIDLKAITSQTHLSKADKCKSSGRKHQNKERGRSRSSDLQISFDSDKERRSARKKTKRNESPRRYSRQDKHARSVSKDSSSSRDRRKKSRLRSGGGLHSKKKRYSSSSESRSESEESYRDRRKIESKRKGTKLRSKSPHDLSSSSYSCSDEGKATRKRKGSFKDRRHHKDKKYSSSDESNRSLSSIDRRKRRRR